MEENIMIWDIAAGIANVKAAGGTVILSKGSVKNSFLVFAANGSLPINT